MANQNSCPDSYVTWLQCLACGRHHPPETSFLLCPECGPAGFLSVTYDYPAIRRRWPQSALASSRERGMWRYLPLLPVSPTSAPPPLVVGGTPLYPLPHIARRFGVKELYVKDEGQQPTGSLKDRASAIAVVRACELGVRTIATASTGNAAAALAALCASVQLKAVIFVPKTIPPAKLAQLIALGAHVLMVDGSYDEAFDLCTVACQRFGWYNRNTGLNPYMTEGKKTAALELCEQLGWRVPDLIFVPVGDGCILGGMHKGFADLLQLGWIDRLPRLVGVQSAGSNYLYRAWQAGPGHRVEALAPCTIADSIAVRLPRDPTKALRAVDETGGCFVCVTDEQITTAIKELARLSGVFAEPAAAAAFAGLRACAEDGALRAGETAVLLITGNGLKDTAPLVRSLRREEMPTLVAPRIESIERIFGDGTG